VKFALDRHPFFWLTQVIGARDRELAQGLRDYGLRVPEWRALAALYSREKCAMSELAELATIDRTTLTRTVDRMADAGWLARRADEADARVTRLALTAAGRRMFERVWPDVQRLNDLGQMRANLDEYVGGETHA
jgi:DNA-binding MarR family transcriptional regulator